jgi:AmmeMemoRadiSam system protein A
MLISAIERRTLLHFARNIIGAHLERRSLPVLAPSGGLDRRSGAFVTLRIEQHLRGCIGYPDADQHLLDVVRRCSISAATEDPRFPPLAVDDLGLLGVEISVLGPVEPVADLASIDVGRHGLIVQHGYRRGLLLPQVAIEWAWDRDTFLSQTSIKAGLQADAWQKGAQIFRFEAEVFGEAELANVALSPEP